ncbi:MAG: ABC transporter ATP-binding protein [Bacillota bacterium]|nr:ABC transporter ATP-binding protein [Bacillota bacterium]
MSEKLVEVFDLSKSFPVKMGKVKNIKAVDDVSFYINRGETLGLVGESGCGKSTVGKTVLRLYEPTSGRIIYDNSDITHADMKPYRKKTQMIFQNPFSSLDPHMTVEEIIGEPIDIHHIVKNKEERKRQILKMLEAVGIGGENLKRYPHEFSGGQQQRISIARALAVSPEFIVCDEPVSSLDVSVQAQILNMFKRLKDEKGLTYLFISHDMSVISYLSDRIAVMYLGIIVEIAGSNELLSHPAHPYTQALLSLIKDHENVLKGEMPSPIIRPSGCPFCTRCRRVTSACSEYVPKLKDIGNNHFSACRLSN